MFDASTYKQAATLYPNVRNANLKNKARRSALGRKLQGLERVIALWSQWVVATLAKADIRWVMYGW